MWPQSSTTSLNGTIEDSSGAVVAGASLSISNNSNGFQAATHSDGKGQYEFAQLAPGTYTVTVKATGLGTQVKVAELLVNQPATIVFTLSVKAMTETVDVSAATQTLNTTDATIGNAVSGGTIEALPMEGRNVADLLSLQPGVLYLGRQVNQAVDSRSGAVAGARSDQSNITLDGVDDNDQENGFAFTSVLRSTLDSVEEFRVTTTNSNSDSGRSSGGQISIITKSGTNQFHGSLYEYNRNTATAANDWFNKQAELSSGLPNKPGELIRNTFGAAIGGPIKKDRLFFFLNFEQQRTAENKQETQTVPTNSLRAGNVKYFNAGGSLVTLTPTQIASMGPSCATCAIGPGVDPNSLTLFNQYPQSNGLVLGDGGLNTASYTWSAPNPIKLTTYIAKIDYSTGKHHLFVRGNLQGDSTEGPPQFPGEPPSYNLTNNTKGIAANDSWMIRSNLINSFRYGYIRQGIGNRGAGDGAYVDFGGLSSINAENRTTLQTVPVHNFVDDVTWVKREHTLQFGVNYRLIHNLTATDNTSWNSAVGSYGFFPLSGIANTGQNYDPGTYGFPAVGPSFTNSYNNAIIAATGLISGIYSSANYSVSPNGLEGNLLNQGTIIGRDFKTNEFEYYLQDQWRARPNLTITFGLHHTLLQTPYEVHGQQVQSVTDLQNWFQTRTQFALLGVPDQPNISYAPSGQARGLKGYWAMDPYNIAPRLGVAYSPSAEHGILHTLFGSGHESSIRAGVGVYYDHFGQGIVNSFSQYGSFSLSATTTSAPLQEGVSFANDPRFTGIHNVPPPVGPSPAPPVVDYPTQPLTGVHNQNAIGVDNHVTTPYSFAFNTSIERQLKGGFTLDVAYVGRLGRHLMQEYDWGEPLDLVDPASGMDYYAAATELSKSVYAGATNVAAIPYFEHEWPAAAGGGLTATQNIYNMWKTLPGNETFDIWNLDILCTPACSGNPPQTQRYFAPQYGSLVIWDSNGYSSYNAGQIQLRHPMTKGLQLDFSYTLSKSLDLGSDTERTCEYCNGGVASPIISTWHPRDNYAVSDFDTRHMLNGEGVYSLPFGRGRPFLQHGGISEAILGGWQLTGLARWTSGLPFGIDNSSNWSTNWTQVSWMVQTAPVQTGKHIGSAGVPQAFTNPTALEQGYITGSPVRNAYPGEAGQRNRYRGDGYFGIDTGLSKTWSIRERHTVKFAWEVFNVTNSARFDVYSMNRDVTSGGFGNYGAMLTAPRVQQFSLRYGF
ncbi:MAG TPA: carboxypeptidase regulatory-like domain-containing protein [Candidatus Sulfotelmatobacter sp.]